MDIRYEQYNNSPLYLAKDIERTADSLSDKANWHENLEIQYCQEGSGYFITDGVTYDFSKGQIAVCNCNAIHYTGTKERIKYTCLILDSKFYKECGFNCEGSSFTPVISNEKIVKEIKKLCTVYYDSPAYALAKQKVCLLNILIELFESHSRSVAPVYEQSKFETIKKSIKYIRENYNKKMSLEEIARFSAIDKYTLSREFKKATSNTVVEYINRYRCLKVVEFLKDNVPVSESAERCGFTNISYFTKVFKKYYGTVPSKYKSH